MESKKQKEESNFKIEKFKQNGWEFEFSQGLMMESTKIDEIGEKLELQFTPAVTFDKTYAMIANKERNFLYYFHPVDSLRYCNYKHREDRLKVEYKDESNLDIINVLPYDMKVYASKFWKERQQKVLPSGKQITVLEHISDWSFSTPYKGSLVALDGFKQDQDWFEEKKPANVTISVCDEDIPLKRLGKENKIIWNDSITLFEDDLEDFGYSQASLKFRVMKDCFYGLNRSYIRVDNVAIRLLETRFFHDFNTEYILRQFSHKEISYQEMEDQGIKLNSKFNINPQQADIISQGCPVKFVLKDKIQFGK